LGTLDTLAALEEHRLIRRFLERDLFAKHSGIELELVEPGHARARMEIRNYHLNGANIVHGGAIFTLADYAFAGAVNSREQIAVGISATISYAKAATAGVLIADAREISLNHKLGTYLVEVRDEENALIAMFQGTAYRKKEKHQKAEG
jgi:acyl-CoA thioesterase